MDSQTAPAEAAAQTAPDKGADRGLRGNRDFLKLWSGESLAMLGSEVTVVALPLVAVVLLAATPTEMGILGAVLRLPALLYLVVGVWLDRVRRRPVMIWADLGRFVLLLSIPLLYLTDQLAIGWLYVVAFGVAVMGIAFDVAYQAYLPSLVSREHLGEANGKLSISHSVAQLGAPALAAALVARFNAAVALLVGSITCLISAINLATIRTPEPRPVPEGDTDRPRLLPMITAGLKYVVRQPILRPMVISTGIFVTFWSGIQTLYILFLVQDLKLPSGVVALIFAAGGAGAVVGATLSIPALRRFGPGRTAIWCTIICNPAFLLIPFTPESFWPAVVLLTLVQFATGLTMPMSSVSMGSVRMALTPDNMQGRVASAFRGLSLGLAPLGAFAAGASAEIWGIRPVLVVFGLFLVVPIFVYLFSPIPGLKTLPEPAE
ncbi:MFS transporter [Micromonospora sp. NPDC047074]|uniref:MFS transporter n=1 Tax=Micromonospora sp. NPDC047074 TaxID=3154339 RepID=UPI00340F3D48